jgi:hypothetical protein
MDENACNYNPDATIHDGNCDYPGENEDCDGNCLDIIDCSGNCGGEDISCYQIETGLVGKWGIGETVENGECEDDDNANDEGGPPETLIFNSDGTAEFFMSDGENMTVNWGVNDSTQLCFSGLNSDDNYDGDDGSPDCLSDCEDIDNLDGDDPMQVCPFLNSVWEVDGSCAIDCVEDGDYQELDMMAYICEGCYDQADSTDTTCVDWFDTMDNEGSDECGDCHDDCSEYDDTANCHDNCDNNECGCDDDLCCQCHDSCQDDDCHYACDETECAGDDGPPECLLGCTGIENIDPQMDASGFCGWLTTTDMSSCSSGCDGELLTELDMMSWMCDGCLVTNNCDEYFNDDNGEIDCSNCDCGGDPQDCWESEGGQCCSDSGFGDGGIECVGMLEIIIPAVRAQVMEECGTTSLTGIYSLPLQDLGANLVSFWALPEDPSLDNMFAPLAGNITGIIGQGTAALPNDVLGWVGSLDTISALSSYWVMVNEPVWFDIVTTELTPLNTTYEITEGNNLVSWPSRNSCSVGDAIPDEFEENVCGIIGEGVAAIPNETFGWIGSLQLFQGGKGYWLCSDIDMYYNWDAANCEGTLSRKAEQSVAIPSGYEYKQSTKQAFYFIESIENIKVGDWILAYNSDEVIGARQWQGSIIDVPAMGDDGSDFTKGYIETGEVPSFKILRGDELINLEGNIPSWDNNQLYMVSSLTEPIPLPETFSLDRAYPNPFNPTTTLSFAIPVDSEVSLSIYNMQGREVSTLIDGNMDAGYHSVVWDANSYASGVYFVKMVAGEFVSTQKLMLIK